MSSPRLSLIGTITPSLRAASRLFRLLRLVVMVRDLLGSGQADTVAENVTLLLWPLNGSEQPEGVDHIEASSVVPQNDVESFVSSPLADLDGADGRRKY